jgi:hypothetical protein
MRSPIRHLGDVPSGDYCVPRGEYVITSALLQKTLHCYFSEQHLVTMTSTEHTNFRTHCRLVTMVTIKDAKCTYVLSSHCHCWHDSSAMHVAAKITISPGFSLQEEHLMSWKLFLRRGVWEKESGIDELRRLYTLQIHVYTFKLTDIVLFIVVGSIVIVSRIKRLLSNDSDGHRSLLHTKQLTVA